ncbi:GTPase domain-containing protein [Mariniblastus sp.]|nr:GTPase domain-containing protein [Mariniblastus sp.]
MSDILEIQRELEACPFIISVVGHTNTGKTSIVRTLSGEEGFGKTKNTSGVTEKPESVWIQWKGHNVWNCHDTPGFEMAQEAVSKFGRNVEFDEAIRYLKDNRKKLELELEYLALQNVEKASLILYVINVGSPPSDRHADELLLLGRSGKPIIPIFNFCKEGEKAFKEWRDFLRKEKLHTFVKFDSFENTIDDKINLFDAALGVVRESVQERLIQWQLGRWKDEKIQSQAEASRAIATLVQRVMSYRPSETSSKANQDAEKESVLKKWRKNITSLEYETFEAIGSFYKFEKHEKFIKNAHWDFDGEADWKPTGWFDWMNPYCTDLSGEAYATPTDDSIVSIVRRCLFVWAEAEKLGRAAIGRDEDMDIKEQHYKVDLENLDSYWQGTPQNLVEKRISPLIQDPRFCPKNFFSKLADVKKQFPKDCDNKQNQELRKEVLDKLRPDAGVTISSL